MVSLRALAVVCMTAVTLLACSSNNTDSTPPPVTVGDDTGPRTRYAMANQCFVMQSVATGHYVSQEGASYHANQTDAAQAEGFYLKPSALGYYMLYNRNRQLLNGNGGVTNIDLQAADANAIFKVAGLGDNTQYPPTPEAFREPTKAEIDAYRNFQDPNSLHREFTFTSASGERLAVNESGNLILATAADENSQAFVLKNADGCENFPEASSNTEGETFKGTTEDGRVLGMVDAHVHISATDFLGKAEWGSPFHKHGVTHALGFDCEEYHGPNGVLSVVEAAYSQDFDGHDTTGWPTFPEWPSRNNLFHEAIYWKWLERAWMAGLRIIVNDLVDNETLCELSRNAAFDPTLDCNSMNNAGRQAGTMYAMQDYIDAQYGGRGDGFYQISLSPEEARQHVENGKAAVILGIEISNLLNCKVNTSPLRTQEPFEEDGSGLPENSWTCAMTETGADNEIHTQLQRIHDWGVRQVITIHEFDNAFGGNGIFGGLVLNLGNREDTGGIPGGALANSAPPGSSPENPIELPSGEFWTTYDCPVEGETPGFSGYLWGNKGGDALESLDPTCPYMGQNGRPGGPTPCYPAAENFSPDTTTRRQCNARWLTPLGLYFYGKLMEFGMIFDIDHLELEMKTQALELAEAQNPPYPFVSTHGTFGGTSVDQAQRILNNGGVLYPSIGGVDGHLGKMAETRAIHSQYNVPHLFGFGFGTDTNGLSGQAGPRNADQVSANPISYPYRLFEGGVFDQLDDFENIQAVTFNQPETKDPDGNGRTWHIDVDGHAQYGMLSGTVREMMLEGNAQDMQDMFNAAEAYLRMWSMTNASRDSILAKTENDSNGDGLGNVVVPSGVLRPAPLPNCEIGRRIPDPSCGAP